MPDAPYTSDGRHNFRWRYPNGRVSWTYPTREQAKEAANPLWPGDMRLQASTDNGRTWQDADAHPEPPYECAHCGKRFDVGGSLTRDGLTFPLCHPNEGLDCYRLVTVYEEPIGSRRPEPPTEPPLSDIPGGDVSSTPGSGTLPDEVQTQRSTDT